MEIKLYCYVFNISIFLHFRCGSKQGEDDYRPLFENFVQDLLSTVNKPDWPAAELLLSLLGRLLVSFGLIFHRSCTVTSLENSHSALVSFGRFTSSVISRQRWL